MADDGSSSFQELVATLDYPMFVVTAAAGGRRAGCLVGFATQASLEPARLLVCLSQANFTHGVAAEASAVAVHLLGADQRELAALFGEQTGDEVDKFARCPWHYDPTGPPVLEDCRAAFVATIVDRLPLGDHTGFLLEPLRTVISPPLGQSWLSFQSVTDLSPGHPA
ncbi:MAG: flavin reductase family protein [Acidimicrobiales bacterium]